MPSMERMNKQFNRMVEKEEIRKSKEQYEGDLIKIKDRKELCKKITKVYIQCYKVLADMIKFDRRYFNIKSLKNDKKDKSTHGIGRVLGGPSYISQTLNDSGTRKIRLSRVENGVEDLTNQIKNSDARIKVNCKKFINEEGALTIKIRKLLGGGIAALPPWESIIELVKMVHFCRMFWDTMEVGIATYYPGNNSMDKCFKKFGKQIELLIVRYKDVIEEFVEKSHINIEDDMKNQKESRKRNIRFFMERTDDNKSIKTTKNEFMSEEKLAIRELWSLIKKNSSFVEKHVSTNTAKRLIKEFDDSCEEGKKKSEIYFKTIVDMAEDKEKMGATLEDYKKAENGKLKDHFYAGILSEIGKFRGILKTDLKNIESEEKKLEECMISREALKETLKGKDKEEIIVYCNNLISKIKNIRRQLDENSRRLVRDLASNKHLPEELNNWMETNECKKWFNGSIKPFLGERALRRFLFGRKFKKAVADAKKAEKDSKNNPKDEAGNAVSQEISSDDSNSSAPGGEDSSNSDVSSSDIPVDPIPAPVPPEKDRDGAPNRAGEDGVPEAESSEGNLPPEVPAES